MPSVFVGAIVLVTVVVAGAVIVIRVPHSIWVCALLLAERVCVAVLRVRVYICKPTHGASW